MICDNCEYTERCESEQDFICPYDDAEPTNSELNMLWD